MSSKENMGAWFEEWCSETFDLKLRGHGRSGYDALDAQNKKYQIKCRDNAYQKYEF